MRATRALRAVPEASFDPIAEASANVKKAADETKTARDALTVARIEEQRKREA